MPENLGGLVFGVQEQPLLGDRLMAITDPDLRDLAAIHLVPAPVPTSLRPWITWMRWIDRPMPPPPPVLVASLPRPVPTPPVPLQVNEPLWTRLHAAEQDLVQLRATYEQLALRVTALEQPWWWTRVWTWFLSLRG